MSCHQLLYRRDTASPIHEDLRGLVLKTVGMADLLKKALSPLAAQIQMAFVFGSFAHGRQHAASDVDLMVVGNTSVAIVAKALVEPQRRLSREINPTIYRSAEFAVKLREGHHFLTAVMARPKIFLIGDEHEPLPPVPPMHRGRALPRKWGGPHRTGAEPAARRE